MIEGFMVEAKWFNGGGGPTLEEYVENGVSTAGAYMALVHLFFLIGEGVNDQNAQLLNKKPYPRLFSAAGRILRLWDDLGTAKVHLICALPVSRTTNLVLVVEMLKINDPHFIKLIHLNREINWSF